MYKKYEKIAIFDLYKNSYRPMPPFQWPWNDPKSDFKGTQIC